MDDPTGEGPTGPRDPKDIPSYIELAAIVEGITVSESAEDVAKALLKAGLVPAVRTICNLSAFGASERIKLDAAKFVVERNLGKETLGGDVWDTLLREFSGGTEKGH